MGHEARRSRLVGAVACAHGVHAHGQWAMGIAGTASGDSGTCGVHALSASTNHGKKQIFCQLRILFSSSMFGIGVSDCEKS